MLAANFGRDQRGAVIVEVTIVLTFMFVLPRHRSQSPRGRRTAAATMAALRPLRPAATGSDTVYRICRFNFSFCAG